MDREAAVRWAIKNMELEGFVYTPEEMEMWDKIARGELPIEYALEEAQRFNEEMRKRFPEKFVK